MNTGIKAGLGILGTIGAVLGIKALTDHFIYHKDGFNNLGYNRQGFNRDGYDKYGFDSKGYNSDGFARSGYDREGYNSEGYNVKGFDRSGRDRHGYDKAGYNASGYNRMGYNIAGFNSNGLDRSGKDEKYYVDTIEEMNKLFVTAQLQMKMRNFPYALRDIRIGIEKGVKCVICHKLGDRYCDSNLNRNIDTCSRNSVFDNDFTNKLHSARNHCNDTAHDNCEKTYDQVYFAHKVLEEVTEYLKGYISFSSI